MSDAAVFISYSSKDAPVAHELCARLEESGVPCWIAPRDITAGQDWSAAIPPAVDACKAMVLVLSSHANASRQIAHEAHLAHNAGATIVPFRIERVKPEGALRYLLSGIHYVNAFEEREPGIAELAALLRGLEEGHRPPPLLPDRGAEHGVAPQRAPRSNLPLQLTSFLGRDAEIARLRSEAGDARLLTLVGTGGVGKTRLALALADSMLDRCDDGAWFVDLALIEGGDAVASAAAAALAVRPAPGQSAADALTESVGDRRMLVVFDGCDRVRDAAGDLIEAILRTCPNARVVSTSRQALGVEGEIAFNVEPLDLDGAVALFAERARAVSGTFAVGAENAETIARICRRLDGIPLAIELAAAKMRVIGPKQLDEKLDERFRILATTGRGRLPRQQTLRATIDWSFDLLDGLERSLFRRMAVFAGSCTLRAAVEICSDEADEWAVLETLSSLVDKSLVVVESFGDDQRYRMLNSIREYGLERLTEAGETAAIEERHARFYAAFVRDLTPLVHALDDAAWSRRVALEIDNLRQAVEWALLSEHAPAAGIALLADLEWPELVATPQEALRWYESAAERAAAMPDAIAHARILRHCVVLANLVGAAPAQLEAVAQRAVEAARGSGDANELARALATLGAAYRTAGRFDEACDALARAYETPELLTALTKNAVLRLWAVTDLQRGEVELARSRFSEVARLERPGSEAHASALLNLGELEFASGNVASAREAALAAKETYARLHSVHLVLLLANLAAYAIAENDLEGAREHLREALQIVRRSGSGSGIAVLEHHAHLAALLGDRERAVVLVGYTDAHYVARGEIRQRTERWGHARLMALLAETYAEEERERRMSEGARLTPEQAITWAAAIHETTSDSAAMPPKG